MTKYAIQFGAIEDTERPSIPMNFGGPTAQAYYGARVVGWRGHQPMIKYEAQFGAIKDTERPSIPMNFGGPTAQHKQSMEQKLLVGKDTNQ